MPTTPKSNRNNKGAALLLLLIILGLGMATALLSFYSVHQSDRKYEKQTQVRLAAAREALLGFAAKTGRLPRPTKFAVDGQESREECKNAAACTGFVPWITLGIDGVDGWGKLIHYSVTPEFTESPVRPISAGDKRVLSRTSYGKTYLIAGARECPIYAQCPPAVLFSSGKYNFGTSAMGIRLSNNGTQNIDEQQNDAATTLFMQRPSTTDETRPGGVFDDSVTWISIQDLNKRLRVAPIN